MATGEYQPGLGLSGLQVALQKYMSSQKERDEQDAKEKELMVNSAKLGKSTYDYWAMDQMSKQKELLAETIDGRNVYETSDTYKDSSLLGDFDWNKGKPSWNKGRMFTSGEDRVQLTEPFREATLLETKPKMPVSEGFDSADDLGFGKVPKENQSYWDSIDEDLWNKELDKVGELDQYDDSLSVMKTPDAYPVRPNIPIDEFDDFPIDAINIDSSMPKGGDPELMKLIEEGWELPLPKGGAPTSNVAQYSDTFDSTGKVLGCCP